MTAALTLVNLVEGISDWVLGGDSYYEYLIKVWLQHRNSNWTYLYDMYEEAMKVVKHLLVQKSIPNGLVFVVELLLGVMVLLVPKWITWYAILSLSFFTIGGE